MSFKCNQELDQNHLFMIKVEVEEISQEEEEEFEETEDEDTEEED